MFSHFEMEKKFCYERIRTNYFEQVGRTGINRIA